MARHMMIGPAPDEVNSGSGGSSGGDPEEDLRNPRVALRAAGFTSLAFGLATGTSLAVLRWFITFFPQPIGSGVAGNAIMGTPGWDLFLIELVGGTLMATIYNMMLIRRFNLFGLSPSLD